MTTRIWTHARLATMAGERTSDSALVDDGALAVDEGTICWVGRSDELPPELRHGAIEQDLNGALVTPGLIDCHTHLVYGGDRAREFELRLQGATYEEIACAGGGILSTVRATRAADDATLLAQARGRLLRLMAEGVTTVEIKSGYGLNLRDEARCLRVARELGRTERVTIRTTFLGAHVVPPEFTGRPDEYVDAVVAMLPVLAREELVDAVDAFCERGAFNTTHVRRLFEAARAHGLPVKLHAEQLSDSSGAELAASFGALSCDHLEWLGEPGVRAMARAGSVAVLLPGAFYFLRETRLPPIDLLRREGVPMAVSTDCNPGTSPCTSLLLMLNMACTLFGLTPHEALAGVTRNAAKALALADRGVLAPGRRADFVVWNAGDPADLCYPMSGNPCAATFVAGVRQ